MEALKNSFKPEFLNRLDEIIVFHKLSDADIIRIIDIMLSQFAKRLESINMHIVFTDKLKMHIKQKGTNLEYGARPLKRTIQKEIEDNMSAVSYTHLEFMVADKFIFYIKMIE